MRIPENKRLLESPNIRISQRRVCEKYLHTLFSKSAAAYDEKKRESFVSKSKYVKMLKCEF